MAPRCAKRRFGRPIVHLFVAGACGLCTIVSQAQDNTPKSIRLEPRSVVQKRLKSFADDNQIRERAVRELFAESGCAKRDLSEESIRVASPPNVICILPGETDEVIVVGAHTDKVLRAGDGVVDNWSGASLLPSLFFSLNGLKRHHTFVFVGFASEETGLLGSEYYVSHLSAENRAHIEAMVNLDSLGLTSTKVWASHADRGLLEDLNRVARESKLPVSDGNVDNIGTTDSESFASYRIPRITLHSVTPETLQVLHSAEDRLAAIHLDDYYESYRLIAKYLASLDRVLSSPAVDTHKSVH